MSLTIYSAEDVPEMQWSNLTKNSLYVSPKFVRIWRTMNGRDIFFLKKYNAKPSAGMAGVMFGRSILSRFQSMPDGIYGGPFFAENYPVEEKKRFIGAVFEWLRARRVLRADIHNPSIEIENEHFRRADMVTQIISLNTDMYVPPDAKIREHIRTGKRRGAIVSVFDNSDRLDEFFDLVKKTSQHHRQKPRFPKSWFGELLKLSAENNRILWLGVTAGSKLVGSRICFIDKAQLLTWQYYSDREYGHLKPGYLLLDYIIRYACKRKIKTINLGCSPPEAESLLDYKKRWGGKEKTLNCYTYFSRLGKLYYSRR